jgi:hypothetical protein
MILSDSLTIRRTLQHINFTLNLQPCDLHDENFWSKYFLSSFLNQINNR